jgi:hypothetical protein
MVHGGREHTFIRILNPANIEALLPFSAFCPVITQIDGRSEESIMIGFHEYRGYIAVI